MLIRRTSSPCILSVLLLDYILLIRILQVLGTYPCQSFEWSLYLSSFALHALVTLAFFLYSHFRAFVVSPPSSVLCMVGFFDSLYSSVTALEKVFKDISFENILAPFSKGSYHQNVNSTRMGTLSVLFIPYPQCLIQCLLLGGQPIRNA